MSGLSGWLSSSQSGFGVLPAIIAAGLILLLAAALPSGARRAVKAPLLLLVLHLAARYLEHSAPRGSFAERLLSFIAVFVIFASIARSVFLLLLSSVVARRFTRPLPKILRDVLQGFLYFIVAILALRAAGVEPGSLLTTSALVTAVIGLSLQETLGNLFAGLALQAAPPFDVGDWVQFSEAPEGIGQVIEINWRATHLLTITQVEVIVPNGVIAKSSLRNFSRPTPITRRDTRFILPQTLAPEIAREILLDAVRDTRHVREDPPPSVVIGEFGERGVEYTLRYFVDDFGQRDVIDSQVRQRVWYALGRAEVTLPAPRRRIEFANPIPQVDTDAPSHTTEIKTRLGKASFLKDVAESVISEMAPTTRLLVFGPSETIIRQHEFGDELFVIEQGEVEVIVTRSDGSRQRVATLTAGQFFGEAALLTGEQRTATIVALTHTELLVIPRAAFVKATEVEPTLGEKLTSALTTRMTELSQAVAKNGPDGELDEERRSAILFQRIRRFFSR